MVKQYLIKYLNKKTKRLNYKYYELCYEIVWFWGLFKFKTVVSYPIYIWQHEESILKRWDKLITERIPVKYISNYFLESCE